MRRGVQSGRYGGAAAYRRSLYPDVLLDGDTLFLSEDSGAGRCEAEPQNLATKILAAWTLFSRLNGLITENRLYIRHVVFNAQKADARSERVSDFKGIEDCA